MNTAEAERRRDLAQVTADFIDVVTDGLIRTASAKNSAAADDEPPRLKVAREASTIVKSFIASDRMYLATELIPMYQVMGTYLPEYAPGADYEAMLEVDERDNVGIFRELHYWKYSPSPLFESIIRADSSESTYRALDYVERALPLARAVCALDGRVVQEELNDLKQFEEMLVCKIQNVGIAPAGTFDTAAALWRVPGRETTHSRTYGDDHLYNQDVDELISTFIGPPITRKQARLIAESVDYPCATDRCKQLTKHGQIRCQSCAQFVIAARIDGEWHEIEDVGDGHEVAPGDGCSKCNAIFLTVDMRNGHLQCPFCDAIYSLRQVRRYLVDRPF